MANWAALQEQLIAKPVVKRAKHAIHFKDGKQITAVFSGKPCHYFDGKLWKPIDTKLLAVGTEYGAPGLKPRVTTGGLVRIDGTNYSQQSTRIGIFNPTTKAFTAIKTIPLGSLDEDKLIAESGVWRRELRLTEDGLKEEIIIASKPTNTGATLKDWLVLETAVSGVSFPDGWLNDYEVGEFKFLPPRAHDAQGNEADCKRYARTIGGVQYIYTGVSAVWLNSAVYPVVIDPDFLTDTSDADIRGESTAYATARATSTEYNAAAGLFSIGQLVTTYPEYSVWRGYIKFDTSSIGAGSTITQVNLDLILDGKNVTSNNFDIQIAKYDWSQWAGAQSNATYRETAFDGALSADADDSIWKNSADVSTQQHYSSGNLSTSWVSKTGTTYYALRSSRDVSGTAPTPGGSIVYERVQPYSANDATSSNHPKLVVAYTTPSSLHTLSLLGVGK